MLETLNRELEYRVAERTEELRKSEAEFRMRAELLNIASEAIMVHAMDDTILFWNPGAESLYGWRREEVLGKNIHTVLRTVFPIPREEIEQALQEQRYWQGNLTQKTKSGTEIVVACRKSMNYEGDAVLEVGRDITTQLRAEEVLRDTEKLAAMGRVAGIIAHEINNPLAAITNIFYLLREHPSLDGDARRLASMAEQELLRVSHITRQTLSFYRESKQHIPVLAHELLDDVLEFQERELYSNRIEVSKYYSSSITVLGFPVELRQVFMNLIGNAIQAMPGGGHLRLHVRESTDWTAGRRGIMISVIDTGMGIRPEDAKHLFEPFFSTKNAKGTGLGLWICKGIIQKYNGTISFRSFRYRGRRSTCFQVFIPATAAQSLVTGAGTPTMQCEVAERRELLQSASTPAAHSLRKSRLSFQHN
jgi:PAS domain S-box-containing protein